MDTVETRVTPVIGTPLRGTAVAAEVKPPTAWWNFQTLLAAGIAGAVFMTPACKATHPKRQSQKTAACPHVDTSLARFIRKDTSTDDTPAFDKACALELFLPNFQQVASLKKRLGDGAFIALDEAGYSSHAARQRLEEQGTPVFLPLTETVCFKGEQSWTLAIQDLRDQSAYLLYHPKRGLRLVPSAGIDKQTLETFFAP